MLTKILAALFCVACLVPGALADPPPPAKPPIPYDTPIKSELDKVFGNLVDQLKQADALVVQLRGTAIKKPEDTQKEIDAAASTLSTLADRLQPNGDIADQLLALRNAAAVHRKRVQELAKDSIEEQDRTNILASWDKVIQDADKAQSMTADMRNQLVGALQKLRMRQVGISELLLAGQYQAAVNALTSWLGDLEATVTGLHKAVDMVGVGPRTPTS